MSRDFWRRFDVEVGQSEAERRFINRALLRILDDSGYRCDSSDVAYALGEPYRESFSVEDYLKGDFRRTLLAVEARIRRVPPYFKLQYSESVEDILSASEVDLGIAWEGGKFVPKGARELDDALVNASLEWLRGGGLGTVIEPLEKALRHFLELHRRPELAKDTVTDAYEALEALAKVVTGRDRDLSSNRELFLSAINQSTLRDVAREYIEYANLYRHAGAEGDQRATPSVADAEAFIHLTGTFIRLCSGIRLESR